MYISSQLNMIAFAKARGSKSAKMPKLTELYPNLFLESDLTDYTIQNESIMKDRLLKFANAHNKQLIKRGE